MTINNLQKNLLFVIIPILLLSFAIFSITHAASNTGKLSGLLKSELNLEIDEDKLNNLPVSKQAEMINLLSMIEGGRTLFSGKTPAEKALGVLAQLVEDEVDKGVWDIVLDSLFKLTQTPVEKTKDIADKSTKVFLSVATIYALPSVPRERIVLDYIQNYRVKGLSDEQAWKEMSDKYKSIGEVGHCNYNATISGDGNCERAIALKRGGESLHSYAQLTYESFNLAQKISSNPQQKEALKQWVLSEVEKTQELSQPSFLSHIATAITTTIVKVTDAVQTFVTSGIQTVTNSLKIASTGVKDFFTSTTSPKETETKPSNLSGQISNAIPNNKVATNPVNLPQQPSLTTTKEKTINLHPKTGCDQNLGSPAPFIALDWDVSYTNMTSQTIYRNNEIILNAPPSVGPSYFDGTIKAGRTYNYVIKAEYKDGHNNSAEANVMVPIDVCGSINSVQNEDVSSNSALPATPPASSLGGGGGSVKISPQSQTKQGETITVRVKEIGCEKLPVDVPPPHPYYSKFSVNVKLVKVNPFIKLEWGSDDINKNNGARYKIYRNGELVPLGVASDQPSFGDGSVITGATYTYLVKTEYADGSIQDSQPLKVTVPKDICGTVPYVDLKVNGSDERVVTSPLSTKFDIELTTFVASDKEGYVSCYGFNTEDSSGTWRIFNEETIYSGFYSGTPTDSIDKNGPFLHRHFFSVICLTEEESKRFTESVGGFFISLPELSSQNISLVNIARLLVSGFFLEERPQTGNFFGRWGDKTITHVVPQSYIVEILRKFRPRADAVEVIFSPLDKENGSIATVIKSIRPCQPSIKRGNFLKLEVLYNGESEYRDPAVLMLSSDANLDINDLILDTELLNPFILSYRCGDSYSEDMHISHYIPDTVPSGNYFIGLLFKDGRQITAPLTVE